MQKVEGSNPFSRSREGLRLQVLFRAAGRASPSGERGCGSCSIRRARHRALGKLDAGPDVHVDDDGDDLEHLLRAEVLGERVVEAHWGRANGRLKRAVGCGS